ncbi:MAG: hypothetical protein NVSMB57_14820 [Actinomycetota bacterium]
MLWFDGQDLTRKPLEERRALLERIVTPSDKLQLTLSVDGRGKQLFDAAKQLGFEGVVAKRLGSTYVQARRSKDWRKVKAVNRIDCVILGWTPGEGSRSSGFGALLLGAYNNDELVWIGQVGTGFTEAVITDLRSRLDQIETKSPPVNAKDLPKDARWVEPDLVCEVEYLEITSAGKLRAPSFKGLRPDKLPVDAQLDPT